MTSRHSTDLNIPPTARGLAFAVLEEDRTSREFAVRILDQRLRETILSDADRRFATELVAGTVRRRLTLDTVIETHVSRPRQRVEDPLWTLLQLGAYQLLFLSRGPAASRSVSARPDLGPARGRTGSSRSGRAGRTCMPPHAAVHETVELAKRMGRPQWTGLLNAALRSLAKTLTDEETDLPAADAVALCDGKYRRMRNALFPDPQTDPADYVSRAFSFPRWLIERWLPRLGWAGTLRTAFWFNEPHGVTLRVNPLRANRDDMLQRFADAGSEAVAGEIPESVHLPQAGNVTQLPGFAEGHWTPQDESAMAVGRLLSPHAGETVLDLCAAPGTKTAHLAELMGNTGRIIATDVNPDRLRQVVENAQRLGLTIIEPRPISADLQDIPAGPFDAVLVDAPCSNTGVLGKRPEARWRIQPADIAELAVLQLRLLRVAADRLKPGGRLVYSTCSMEPEENEGVIAALTGRHRGTSPAGRFDLRLEEQQTSLPGQPADGGFRALFRRFDASPH